ncbi:MAG TPA: cation:proton antiporter [Planctomycetota bacterium]|nr:cation:proton antiporter [Planctomycetota bacterium]
MPQSNFTLRNTLLYAGMILATIVLFGWIRHMGEALGAPPPVHPETLQKTAPAAGSHVIRHVLLAMATVIIAGRALGWLLTFIKQPPVIGEVLAGILLGPSLLGRISPETMNYLLPPDTAPYLNVIAQLGVILYMFIVGLELNTGRLREKAHATIAISHASIIAPFVLGSALSLFLYPRFSDSSVPFTSFALFMGVAMAITAFPVLARILTDRRMAQTRLGAMALVCAATDDVTAWCLLAFVVGVAQADVGGALMTCGLAVLYIALMFLVVRPLLLRWLERRSETLSRGVLVFVLAGLLLSALCTEYIGIHAIFGAFLFGAIIPHDSAVSRELTVKLSDGVSILLLPAFFAVTGLRTQIGLVSGPENWMICALIIGVAIAGKFGGSTLAARLSGMSWREAAALGTLMNTRGLMELVVLNIGLDLKVISPTIFAMMVLMALVTTAMTAPIVDRLVPAGSEQQQASLTPAPQPQ